MKAAVLCEPEIIEIKAVKKPQASPGEVLIRIVLAGICGSDHSLYKGYANVPLPVIPGHEAVGLVEALGNGVDGLEVGQRVTIQPNVACGKLFCLSQWPPPNLPVQNSHRARLQWRFRRVCSRSGKLRMAGSRGNSGRGGGDGRAPGGLRACNQHRAAAAQKTGY